MPVRERSMLVQGPIEVAMERARQIPEQLLLSGDRERTGADGAGCQGVSLPLPDVLSSTGLLNR
jgi:hypothetical protein